MRDLNGLTFRMGRGFVVFLAAAYPLAAIGHARADEPATPPTEYGKAELIAELACGQVRESSGVASSHRENGLLWTHNDSGDQPMIYAFDATGQHLGKVKVTGAAAHDWEDMASFRRDNQAWLLLADTGDNKVERTSYELYLLREPDKSAATVEVDRVINFTFEGGSTDCEAVAVDATTGQILLATKEWSFNCKIFALPLAPEEADPQPLVAKQVAELTLPGVTALDISPDGRRAVALTYAHAYEYVRHPDEGWATALARRGREIKLPPRKQSEAVCYSHDGRALFCTSEACPTPLYCCESTDDD